MELDGWQALQGVPGILVGIKGMACRETASQPADKGPSCYHSIMVRSHDLRDLRTKKNLKPNPTTRPPALYTIQSKHGNPHRPRVGGQ